MKKTAVIFPGVGYTKDRPLLYYSGKLAVKNGYELKFMDFSGISWSKEKLKDKEFLSKTVERCIKIAEETLGDAGGLLQDEVVFISKSIGTVVAAAYEDKTGVRAGQICFSPLEAIGSFVKEKGAVLFYGDADPYADYRAIESIAKDKSLEAFRIAGGNHSLETGDIFTDIDNLMSMMRQVAQVIR